jgi:transcription elongation factor Elf1
MALTVPETMDDCLYFTNRGEILAWVYRKECPECHKAKMGKPVVKGKVKVRAKEYVCPECSFTEQKEEHEASLTLESTYTCPECGKEGESTCPYVRKKYKGVLAFVVDCEHCQAQIPLTKKLKEIKKKKKK